MWQIAGKVQEKKVWKMTDTEKILKGCNKSGMKWAKTKNGRIDWITRQTIERASERGNG